MSKENLKGRDREDEIENKEENSALKRELERIRKQESERDPRDEPFVKPAEGRYRREYEELLQKLNDTYGVNERWESETVLSELLQRLNAVYVTDAPPVQPSGLKERIKAALLSPFRKIVNACVNKRFQRQVEFNGFLVQMNNSLVELLHDVFDKQKRFNANTAHYGQKIVPMAERKIHIMYELLNHLIVKNIKYVIERTDLFFEETHKRLESLEINADSGLEHRRQLQEWLTNTDETLRNFERELNLQKRNFQESYAFHRRHLENLYGSIKDKKEKFSTAHSEEKHEEKTRKDEELSSESLKEYDYVLFEGKFRGTWEETLEGFAGYMEFFKGRSNVADIGCGRGEFLYLADKNDIAAYGIDENPAMVEACRQRGLNVIQGDAVAHLQSLEDASLGGAFASQFVEHLTTDQLRNFTDLVYKKLMPGSPLVLETINPLCLYALVQHFLVDLTHRFPLHPSALQFLLEVCGFRNIRTLFLSPVDEMTRLGALEEEKLTGTEKELILQLNERFRKTDEFLFGHQDYAVIGYK